MHGALGRKFHESVYQRTLQQIIGARAISEYAITISHGSFLKILYVDLLVDAGCPFELKAVAKLTDDHISQLIQLPARETTWQPTHLIFVSLLATRTLRQSYGRTSFLEPYDWNALRKIGKNMVGQKNEKQTKP